MGFMAVLRSESGPRLQWERKVAIPSRGLAAGQ